MGLMDENPMTARLPNQSRLSREQETGRESGIIGVVMTGVFQNATREVEFFMKKLISVLLLSLILVVSSVSAFAGTSENAAPLQSSFSMESAFSHHMPGDADIYEKTFKVTQKGGTIHVGFVSITFPKNFMPANELPRTFTAKVFASGGHGVIEFTPDATGFLKPVQIDVQAFKGMLYDEQAGHNVQVKYHQESFLANHFSRYCWQ